MRGKVEKKSKTKHNQMLRIQKNKKKLKNNAGQSRKKKQN
jgi:hypothetical protein